MTTLDDPASHNPDCPNIATGVYRVGPYPCRCTPPAARWRRLLHIHWARPTGRVGGHVIERCRCTMARAVVQGLEPIVRTSWNHTARGAIAEADALERLGGRPSWRELWHRSGRAG